MNGPMILAFVILTVTIILFIIDKLRVDIVAMLALLALLLTGLIDTSASSLFRVDDKGILVGDISNLAGGNVRIRNRNLDNGRTVSFTGLLYCDAESSTYFSDVECGETCTGLDGSLDLICAP